jgi:hypothetical protein
MKLYRGFLVGFCLVLSLAMGAVVPAQGTSTGPDYDSAKKQVLELLKVLKNQDWKRLYDITEFSSLVARGLVDRDAFAKGFASGITKDGKDDTFAKVMASLSEQSAGLVIIEGKSAYVSTTCKIDVSGQKVMLVGIAKLIKVGDAWKWDLTFTDDAEKATSTRTTELLGQPVTGG